MNPYQMTAWALLLAFSTGLVGCASSQPNAEPVDPLWSHADQGPTGMIRVVTLTEQDQASMLGKTYDDLDALKADLKAHVEQYPQASTIIRVTQGREQSPEAQALLAVIREAGASPIYQAIIPAAAETVSPAAPASP